MMVFALSELGGANGVEGLAIPITLAPACSTCGSGRIIVDFSLTKHGVVNDVEKS